MSEASENLIAVDIGNSRVKFGLFAAADAGCVASAASGALPIAAPGLPEPAEVFAAAPDELTDGPLTDWLDAVGAARVAIASVARATTEDLINVLGERKVDRLASEAAPIELRVDEPTRIGVDRVMAAVGANRLRRAGSSGDRRRCRHRDHGRSHRSDGALEGGAILPGPTLAARALGERADALPDIRFGDLDDSPDAVGRSTEPAIRAGVFWGSVGAIRELIARQRDRMTEAPQVLLTGGAAPSIARLIGGPDLSVRCVPHLTLSGIAIAAAERSAS